MLGSKKRRIIVDMNILGKDIRQTTSVSVQHFMSHEYSVKIVWNQKKKKNIHYLSNNKTYFAVLCCIVFFNIFLSLIDYFQLFKSIYHFFSVYSDLHLCPSLFIYLPKLSIYLSMYPSYLSINQSHSINIYISLCVYIYLSIYLSHSINIYISLCVYIYLSLYLSNSFY